MSTHIIKYGETAWSSNNSNPSQSGKYRIQTRIGFEEVGRTANRDIIQVSECEHYYKALVMRVDIYEFVDGYPDLPQYIAVGRVDPRINAEGELEYTLDIEHEGGRNTFKWHLTEVEAVHKLMTWGMKYQRK